MTVVFADGRLFATKTFVRVMLPVFVTVPVKVSNPPSSTGWTGHDLVTAICGEVRSGQVVSTLLFAIVPLHWS
jgi:hypothetical protein